MAINLDLIGACDAIRREAETLADQNYAFNLQKKTGALDFITSPENGGVDASLISFDGGRGMAKLRILYDQRTKSCQISTDCSQGICDDGSMIDRKEAIISISNCLKTPVRQYTNDDMIALCKDPGQFMRDRGFSDLRAAREKFSALILAELDAAIGINYEADGTTTAAGAYKQLDVIGTSGGQSIPLPGNFATLGLDYENNQLTGIPAVIGQGNMDLFWKLQRYSCCNATTPYGDANVEGEVRYYKDQQANSILGANKTIVATFGAMHLLTFNENRNAQQINQALGLPALNLVIPDPAGYPFSWNLDLKYDDCNKLWKMMYSLTWGVFNVFQDDSFSSNSDTTGSPDCDDDLVGMTGVFGYEMI